LTKLARENAVIVSGEALLKITRNETVRNDFLELAEDSAVVLCCRVSPK
jgi:magnesium-transporting ATPase (P-type)